MRDLSRRLVGEGWIDTWYDEEKLLPGQDWRVVIEEAVEDSEIVIICLSKNSVSKEGHVQKELRYAREIALEKPEGVIFIIPLRLDDCEVPRGLRFYQWVDYFGEKKNKSYNSLVTSLKLRYEKKITIVEKEHRIKQDTVERNNIVNWLTRYKWVYITGVLIGLLGCLIFLFQLSLPVLFSNPTSTMTEQQGITPTLITIRPSKSPIFFVTAIFTRTPSPTLTRTVTPTITLAPTVVNTVLGCLWAPEGGKNGILSRRCTCVDSLCDCVDIFLDPKPNYYWQRGRWGIEDYFNKLGGRCN